MTEIPDRRSQLDRIEAGVNELNKQVARMQERQNNQGAKIESHEGTLVEHGQRIREVELAHAVASATTSQQARSLNGRWAAVGAVALVLLGAIGAAVGKLFAGFIARVVS